VLGALNDLESSGLRHHLRGCMGCRTEAQRLDEGLAMFAGAAHSTDPPPELEDRVMRVLGAEWREAPDTSLAPLRRRMAPGRLLLAVAASVALLAGAIGWGVANQVRATHLAADATALRDFLHTLGGKDVRVGKLSPQPASDLEGSFVVYDGSPGEGESWVLVLVRAPGYSGKAYATLVSSVGRPIRLFPISVEQDGEGWTAMFANVDLDRYDRIRITSSSGELLATGRTIRHG